MNNTDLIHLIKHFMRNEHKAVEEVIDSPLSEVANLIKVLQSCQGKVVFIGVGKSVTGDGGIEGHGEARRTGGKID